VQHDEDLNHTTNIYEYGGRWEDLQRDDGQWYVEDFTLAQLKMLRRFQRYQDHRSAMLNDRFEMITMNELIENVIMLEQDAPRKINSGTKVGLYIELKNYDEKVKTRGIDEAEMLFELLQHYNLSTIADSKDTIPIIIQSFDKNALTKMATLTDLPLVKLCNDQHINDWDEISGYSHGVGVPSDWIMNNLSTETEGDYSQFID